jgi:hypothetical protein
MVVSFLIREVLLLVVGWFTLTVFEDSDALADLPRVPRFTASLARWDSSSQSLVAIRIPRPIKVWKGILQSVIKRQSIASTSRTVVGTCAGEWSRFSLKEAGEQDGQSPHPTRRSSSPPNFKLLQAFPTVIFDVDRARDRSMQHPAVKVAKGPHQLVD